ncbi:MAG: FAD-binding oxidoreductase [bacterium]
MKHGLRNFWGWGLSDEILPEAYISGFKRMVQLAFGLDSLEETPPPKLEELSLRAPRFSLPSDLKSFCTHETYDRANHTYGKSFRDMIRAINRVFDNPPDYVAYPSTEEDIIALINFCNEKKVALIPYGGGSSVVGGVEPTREAQYKGTISCDMKNFDKIIRVNKNSRTARIQAGIYGPALEAGLKPFGLTIRHFPQSFEFSTLGGWIATRAGGHFATLYTHIDEFVQSLRLITPRGIIETREIPSAGDGPDANRFFIGSEGIFGIITEATMRLQSIPTIRASAVVRFSDEKAAIEVTRRISQSGLNPANARLISAMESFSMGIGNGTDTVLLLGFESHDHDQEPKLRRALDICKEGGGSWNVSDVSIRKGDELAAPEASEQWKRNFLRAPYIRNILVRCGIIMETFETVTTWDNLETFHTKIINTVETTMRETCGNGIIMWRFTHIYSDGPVIYYTVIAPGRRGEELAQWDTIKSAVSDVIIANHGPITHHHAVGRDHQPWFEKQCPELFLSVLHGIKSNLDPDWILNPGVLIRPPFNNGK